MKLTTQPRELTGAKVKELRTQGLIPAVFYGRGFENQNLTVQKREFDKVFKEAGESTIINLVIGEDTRPAIVQDMQRDSLTGDILHVDFHGVRMDEAVTVMVPIEFIGEAPAVKEKGGILGKNMTEVEIEALPGDLPHSLVLDLGELKELGESVYVKNISVPDKVKVLLDPETVIATVSEPREEEEEPVEVDVSQVKIEGEEEKQAADADSKEQDGA